MCNISILVHVSIMKVINAVGLVLSKMSHTHMQVRKFCIYWQFHEHNSNCLTTYLFPESVCSNGNSIPIIGLLPLFFQIRISAFNNFLITFL